jgi:3'(2'), 5'-bisphosphate nucleotidase
MSAHKDPWRLPLIPEDDHIRFALDFISEACGLTKSVQAELAGAYIEKKDLSPVTVADLSVQALAGLRLGERLPGHVLVGEESADALRGEENAAALQAAVRFLQPFAPGADAASVCDWIDRGNAEPTERFWTLDPVDGTKGFLRGDQYAIALALIEDGRVQFGVLGCPALDSRGEPVKGEGMVVIAKRGQGTWSRAVSGGAWRRLQVSAIAYEPEARLLRSYEKAHTNASDTDLVLQALHAHNEPITMDSQAKYAVLAAGGAELLLRLLNPGKEDYKERIWDQAAGSIIVEEAGGRVTDLLGQPLDFSRGRTLAGNTGVLATNLLLHEAALEAVHQVTGL